MTTFNTDKILSESILKSDVHSMQSRKGFRPVVAALRAANTSNVHQTLQKSLADLLLWSRRAELISNWMNIPISHWRIFLGITRNLKESFGISYNDLYTCGELQKSLGKPSC